MSNDVLMYMLIGVAALFIIIVIAYMMLRKRMQKSDFKQIQELRKGTESKTFTSEIMYQKLYITFSKLPLFKRYLLKLRRRLEIINIDDEYLTRMQAAKILTKATIIILILTTAIFLMAHSNALLLAILLLFELFMTDTIIDGMVDKIDNNLLKQQIDFFGEIRHAYHEFNMVEEALYQTAQDDEVEVSRQANKIYEILISDDPETELEKYYDIAPNSYLKEFAGISYLTKEFGDRKIDGSSLYLKNLNNITQEMQLEILKRDKLDYVFQSLAVISVVPILFLDAIRNWCVSQFAFTKDFYFGKTGIIVQVLIMTLTFGCYILTRKLKDNGSVNTSTKNTENPWQAKLYKKKPFKKFIDMFIPKEGTREYRTTRDLMKKAASYLKLEWLYINRIAMSIAVFCVSLVLFMQFHRVAVDYVFTNPTADYNILGQMNDADEKAAMEVTELDNIFLKQFRGKTSTKVEDIKKAMERSKEYKNEPDETIETAAKRVYDKLQIVNSEYMQWFEILLAVVFAVIGYAIPILLLKFQAIMRQMEMENEVLQFQTIILMLMKIERVNVEMILEWLERYANIFKEPITKCVNNYESGAWESLEVLKNDIAFPQMIRIVESLQAAVEKIPISEAFDELDTERAYHQEKRKESNERLIARKGRIGKIIGFAPMVVLFVGYLIIPLVYIGLTSMTSSFATMSAM